MLPTRDSRQFCERQIARLEALNFFAQLSVIGLTELRDALLSACASQAQAELVITTWIAENDERPTPAAIHRIARTMNAAVASLPSGCDECAALGGYVRREVVISRGVFAGETREALVPCACALGQAKKAAWQKLHDEGPKAEHKSADLQRIAPLGLVS